MLVYTNALILQPTNGTDDVIKEIAIWVGKVRKSFVDPERLRKGLRQLKFSGGAALSSIVTLDSEMKPSFPYLFNARLTHGQEDVPGRLWSTEIGMSQEAPGATILCTVVLRVLDISTKHQSRIIPTRPGIVRSLIDNCKAIEQTPSLAARHLFARDAKPFLYEIESKGRRHPIVLISHDVDGQYLVSHDRIRDMLSGIAQIVVIPPDGDTFEIGNVIGKRYIAFNGAVNIIWPYREVSGEGVYQNHMLTPKALAEAAANGLAESVIFETVAHRTNLPNEWRHVTAEKVRTSIAQNRLRYALDARSGAEDIAAYETLFTEISNELAAKDQELEDLRVSLENANNDLMATQGEATYFKDALSKSNQGSAGVSYESGITIDLRTRSLLSQAMFETPNLEESLTLIAHLYPDRIVLLDGAIASAKASDRAGFRHAETAFEMMDKLASSYWSDLCSGKGDQEARLAFGHTKYSSKEGVYLSNEGRNARTFYYKGERIFMERHLKIGVKDTHTETWRLHFHWDAEAKKIIIAHCGKHLPL